MKSIVKTSISFLAGLGVGIGVIKLFKVAKQKLDNKDKFEPEFEEDEDISEYIEEDLDDESFDYAGNNNLTENNQSEEDNDF